MLRKFTLLFAAWFAALMLLSVTLAHATEYEVVGVGKSQKEVLVLQDLQGQCEKGSKRLILLLPRSNEAFLGCWAYKAEQVLLMFEDGDMLVLPASEINWNRKPVDG